MTTNDQKARPNVPGPIDSASRIAITALAQFFDERHAAQLLVVDELRKTTDSTFPDGWVEQHAIATAWYDAANTAWELIGGRPNEGVRADRFIRVSTADLAKLLELASSSHTENDAEFAETNRVLDQSAKRIRELTKERDTARARIADLERVERAYIEGGKEEDRLRNRLAELEAMVAKLGAWERYEGIVSARVADLDTQLNDAERQATDRLRRIEELEKQLAAQSLPVDATGKTPGEMLINVFDTQSREMSNNDTHEAAAQAVLRAFGPAMVQKTLESVRERVKNAATLSIARTMSNVLSIIDSELTLLGASDHQRNHGSNSL